MTSVIQSSMDGEAFGRNSTIPRSLSATKSSSKSPSPQRSSKRQNFSALPPKSAHQAVKEPQKAGGKVTQSRENHRTFEGFRTDRRPSYDSYLPTQVPSQRIAPDTALASSFEDDGSMLRGDAAHSHANFRPPIRDARGQGQGPTRGIPAFSGPPTSNNYRQKRKTGGTFQRTPYPSERDRGYISGYSIPVPTSVQLRSQLVAIADNNKVRTDFIFDCVAPPNSNIHQFLVAVAPSVDCRYRHLFAAAKCGEGGESMGDACARPGCVGSDDEDDVCAAVGSERFMEGSSTGDAARSSPAEPCYLLSDLWSFFDEPCAFGLEVNIAIQGTRSPVYFVPHLSAARLFSRSTASSSGSVIFEFTETKGPDMRPTLADKIEELSRDFPLLTSACSCSIDLDRSWFCVSWQPIHCHNLTSPFLTGQLYTYFRFRSCRAAHPSEHSAPSHSDFPMWLRQSPLISERRPSAGPPMCLPVAGYLPYRLRHETWYPQESNPMVLGHNPEVSAVLAIHRLRFPDTREDSWQPRVFYGPMHLVEATAHFSRSPGFTHSDFEFSVRMCNDLRNLFVDRPPMFPPPAPS